MINSYQKNKELSEKIESLEPFLNRSNRLKDIVEKYKDYQIELSLSQEKELILIIYRKENPFNYIWLFGEKNENQKWNAQLALTNVTKHHIRIEDFLANPRNKGYGTILLRFLIQLAKHHDIKEISGDLVIEDKERLKWLIPFYKNMGFSCQLSKNQYYPQILGKINLRAKSPDEV